jgi:hypothetical protein
MMCVKANPVPDVPEQVQTAVLASLTHLVANEKSVTICMTATRLKEELEKKDMEE